MQADLIPAKDILETPQQVPSPERVNPFAAYQAQQNIQKYPNLPNLKQDENPLVALENLHLNASCPIHKELIAHICRSPSCPTRLLCNICVEVHAKTHKDHKYTVVSLQSFINDSLMSQLDLLCKNEAQVFNPLDDTYYGVFSSIRTTFDTLRAQFQEILNRSEETALQKAKGFFLRGRGSKVWSPMRDQYVEAKEAYLCSTVGAQTKELESFIEISNKIQTRRLERDTEIQEVLETLKNQMDKFINRTKENLNLFVEGLFYDKNQAPKPPVIIDPTKVYYEKGFKADHKFLVNSMVYIPKIDQLITASESGTLTAWNPTTHSPIATFKVHNDAINTILYVESENLLVTGSKDKSVRLFPVERHGINIEKPEIFTSHAAPVRSLVLLEGEDRFASAGEDAGIRIWHLKSKNLDTIIDTKGWKTNGDEMAFIRPERWIAVAGKGEIRIYDYVTRELLITESAMKSMGSLAFLNEKRLLVAQDDDDRIVLWKIDNKKKKIKREKKLKFKNDSKGPVYFKCFENSDLIFVSMRSNKVVLFKLSTGEMLRDIDTPLQSTTCITLLRDERRMIIGDSGSNMLGFLQY